MNSESINLSMTPQEADHVAHVLMAALHQPNFMLDSERKTTTQAANNLFGQLGYSYRTNNRGDRVELDDRQKAHNAKRVSPDCEHPGLFARPEDKLDDTRHCFHCGADVPVAKL